MRESNWGGPMLDVDGLNRIAAALEEANKLERERIDKEFPTITMQQAQVGKARFNVHAEKREKSEDDKINPFAGLGPRETKYFKDLERAAKKQEKARGSAGKAGRKS
jgi:hypothetical protein